MDKLYESSIEVILGKGDRRTQVQSPRYFFNHKTVPKVCTEVITNSILRQQIRGNPYLSMLIYRKGMQITYSSKILPKAREMQLFCMLTPC